MNTGLLRYGDYTPITSSSDNGFLCEIISAPNSAIDSSEVFFVSPDRFVQGRAARSTDSERGSDTC
jgi:hypothetical protein